MGERRLRAAKLVGLKSIPSVVLCVGDRDSAALGLIENIQRRSLFYLEEAEAMQTIMSDFGCTQGELAHILGKSRSAVAGKLRLLRLSPMIKRTLQKNSLSEGYARALLRLSNEVAQQSVLEQVTKYGLNLRRTEELIDSTIRTGEIGVLKRKPSVKLRFKDVRAFAETVRTTVEEMSRSGIETEYKITQHEDMYEIRINIKTAVDTNENNL
jgi:ParB family chromosome partitioning protein